MRYKVQSPILNALVKVCMQGYELASVKMLVLDMISRLFTIPVCGKDNVGAISFEESVDHR